MADCMNVAASAAATLKVAPSPSRHRRLFTAIASLPLTAALALSPAVAQDFTVVAGPPVGQQIMNNIGDRGVIEAGGTVSTVLNAVQMLADDQMLENFGLIESTGVVASAIYSTGSTATITNSGTISTAAAGIVSFGEKATIENAGTISTTGALAFGIVSFGEKATIENSGTISTTGASAAGIRSFGSDVMITNSGTISTTELFAYGISSTGPKAIVANSGTISTEGDSAHGLISEGIGAILTSSGVVSTTGFGAYGMESAGPNAIVANSGTVSTIGLNAHGILSAGTNVTLTNSGTVLTTGGFATGILSIAPNAAVTNSGSIISEQWDAIGFTQGNATLNLLAGTVIQGGIKFIGTGNTVSFGPGLNTMLTFSVIPDTILTSGNPYAVSGNSVAVLDRGGFTLTDGMALALAGNIASILDRNGKGQCLPAPDGQVPTGEEDGCATEAWLAGFGGFGGRSDSFSLAGSDYLSGGGLAGLEFTPGGGFSGGIFLGGMVAHGTVGESQDTSQHGGVIGGHAGFARDGYFADLYAALGVLQIDGERRIADNTVAGGLTLASASHAGYFLSPAITIGIDRETGAGVLTPSLRLRYAGLMLDGYSESGAAGAVVVDDRLVHELELRAQLALALTPDLTEDGTLSALLRGGVDVFHRQADITTGTLLGQPIAFTSGEDGTGYRGFAAFDLDLALSGGTSLFGNMELGLDSTGGYSTVAHAGIGGSF
ncbi:MAG: hypothetical protein JWQ89_204 [Devosia sp.]|uniref:autotransporter family protein n=1 Tax=Devosia sp. TaxID=1871048 RepID=UPI002613F406|nr:autotransporter domain-containing protein [Devosia sp.]MDB5538477.1 hypothetical protein [Devosia sp.]